MLLLVDLDGVVYRGHVAVPGVPALLRRRAAAGDTIVYVTNNSSAHRSEYLGRLRGHGAPVSEDRIVTAARATALLLAEERSATAASAGRRPVMVLGGPGLEREIRDAGMKVVGPTRDALASEPDTLAVGVDFALTYDRLSVAAEAVRRGARFVATNRDPVFPTPDGLTAGAGAIVAALEATLGRLADIVIGKPEPRLFLAAAETVGLDAAAAIVIGDGLGTDIAAARAVGARSILMLTGVTTEEQLRAAPEEGRPTAAARDAAELERLLERFTTDSATLSPTRHRTP